MHTIDDKVLQQGAIEDIIELEAHKIKEGNDYISHMIYMTVNHTVKYIKEKFNLTEEMIEEYKNGYKKNSKD